MSVDSSGMLEYWTGSKHEYQFPRSVCWEYKTDTDLYEFAKVCIRHIIEAAAAQQICDRLSCGLSMFDSQPT